MLADACELFVQKGKKGKQSSLEKSGVHELIMQKAKQSAKKNDLSEMIGAFCML